MILWSKTNSNFHRKMYMVGTSTVFMFATVLPHDMPGDKFKIYCLEQHGKKLAKACRVLAYKGMFIELVTHICCYNIDK